MFYIKLKLNIDFLDDRAYLGIYEENGEYKKSVTLDDKLPAKGWKVTFAKDEAMKIIGSDPQNNWQLESVD